MTDSRPVDGADLDYALGRVSTAYRTDAYDEDSADGAIIRDLWQECVSEGMAGEEFRDRIARMIRGSRFPTWTPADFWTLDLPRLYPRSWYLERIDADRTEADRIAVYQLPDGRTGYAYRDIVDGRLPEFVPSRLPAEPERIEPGESIPADITEALDLQKKILDLTDRLKAEEHMRDKAERSERQARRELRQAEEDRDACRDVMTELHGIVHGLLSGRMTIDDGRAALAVMVDAQAEAVEGGE